MATCANHPIKMATARCKTCSKPICNDCKHVTDVGIFCSPECESKTRNFMKRVDSPPVQKKTSLLSKKTFSRLGILTLVLAGVGGFLYFFQDVRSWGDFVNFWAGIWEGILAILPF